MDPLPLLNHVFSMVIQHERQNGLAPTEDSQVMVNVAYGRKFTGKRKFHFNGKQWQLLR